MKYIQKIVWISKDIPDAFLETVNDFKIKSKKLDLEFYISTNSQKPIIGVKRINKEKLYKRILKNDPEIPEDILEFALFSREILNETKIIDTGTHRNAALFNNINEYFIMIDDDVLCYFKFKNVKNKIIIDNNLQKIKKYFFENENIMNLAVDYTNLFDLKKTLIIHKKTLEMKSPDNFAEIALTMMGFHGWSPSDSPIYILTQRHRDDELYKKAIENKLALNYSEDFLITQKPHFISMFSGYNNKMLLPPFFPIGRNQDGIFARTLMACLNYSLICQLPGLVRHVPFTKKRYEENSIYEWKFRINTMIIILLDKFIRENKFLNRNKREERYEEVGKFLEGISEKDDNSFMSILKTEFTKNIDALILKIYPYTKLNNRYSQTWKNDIKKFILNSKKLKQDKNFAIPEELLDKEKPIHLAKEMVKKYGKLLRYWLRIRKALSNTSI